jgi:hypothetical protein
MAVAPLFKQVTMPSEVAATIFEAVTTTNSRLRWSTDSESTAILTNRPAMSDEEWASIFHIKNDAAYLATIGKVWGEKGRLFTR